MKYKVIISIFLLSVFPNNIELLENNILQETDNQNKTIIVYGSGTCHYCIDTKTYLNNNNIPFVFFDLDIYPEKIKEMHSKLRKANISTYDFQIPVVDKFGDIITNDYSTFEIFLSKLK